MEVKDLTPRFQKFYALAQGADPETRWQLWKEYYDFAAVPPIPEGQAMARKLLNEAWNRYASLPKDLSGMVSQIQEICTSTVTQIETLFQTTAPDFRLVTYVGGFEGNAFVAYTNLCMPVEMSLQWAEPVLAHELTHLFHYWLSGSTGQWQRPLAAVIVEEGLANRAAQQLYPASAAQLNPTEWLAACELQRSALIHDALTCLERSDDETLLRFIQIHSQTGLTRTAYALGWWFVGEWLANGKTLAELACIPEKELPELLRQYWQ